jgi:hypothetical protein
VKDTDGIIGLGGFIIGIVVLVFVLCFEYL